jgi:heme/copper-type cytochrome/quinol oxidase subunit 2
MTKFNYKALSGFIVSLAILVIVPLTLFALPGCDPATINNPLGCGNNSVQALLTKIMGLVATVGAIVVVFFVIYSGYKFVTARGNPKELEDAKKIFFATIIGGAILLGAEVIGKVVVTTVNDTIR